jgi:hypothetical protein
MNLRVIPAGTTSSWKHPTSNAQFSSQAIGCWVFDVYLASPLVDEFYKNRMGSFKPAAGGDTAKILRKAPNCSKRCEKSLHPPGARS